MSKLNLDEVELPQGIYEMKFTTVLPAITPSGMGYQVIGTEVESGKKVKFTIPYYDTVPIDNGWFLNEFEDD